jgi:flagellar L-ring protein precursor FlgH
MRQPSLRDPEYRPVAATEITQASKRTLTPTGSIYHASTNRFLFEDYRARRVGDILTVILEEKTDADKKASTSTAKNSNVETPAPKLFGRGISIWGREVLEVKGSSTIDFAGEGGSSQSNSIKGNITVTVAEVLPNGFLKVRGEKIMNLNQGSEVIRIRGIIRPQDISSANTIGSQLIANAEITYKGKGMIADSNDAGWLTRFFNSGWWPF